MRVSKKKRIEVKEDQLSMAKDENKASLKSMPNFMHSWN